MKPLVRIVVLQALLALSQASQGQSLSLGSGWNLIGNNSNAALNPVAVFGNATSPITGISDQVATIWTWDAANTRWMFFAPSFDPTGLASYAAGKGYGNMTSITSGDGYWVNAKSAFSISLPGAQGATPATLSLVQGWNLLGNNSPATWDPNVVFGTAATPISGLTNQIATVWKWDRANSRWMFFAPSFDSAGLASYAASKSYGVLTSIGSGEGFWVNTTAVTTLAPPPTVSGVAATGGAIANANVTLSDAAGITRTASTAADGSYVVSANGLTAPIVVKVSGVSGDSHVTLTSMLDVIPTGGSANININPLTNAIAAVLASGNDTSKLSPITDMTSIQNNLASAKAFLASALSNTLTAAGVTGVFDPVATPMMANGTGADQVFDNLSVTVGPDGSAAIVNLNSGVAANAVDDTAQMDAAFAPPPVVGAKLLISKSTNLSGTPPTIDNSGATLPDPMAVRALLRGIQSALNGCVASVASQSGTISVNNGTADFSQVGTACADFFGQVSPTYLHNGNDAFKDFGGLFSSNLYQAVFYPLYIDRFVTPTKVIVSAPYMRADGIRKKFTTLVANVGGVWQLLGNQRNYDISVQPVVEKRTDLNTTPGTTAVNLMNAFTVGLNIKLNLSAGDGSLNPNAQRIMWVLVTGKGLGDGTAGKGALLKNQSNCPYFTFVSNNADNNATTNNAILPNGSGNCAAYLRLAGIGLDGATAITWPNNHSNNKPAYGNTMASDTQLATSGALDPYTIQVHYCTTGGPFANGAAICSGTERDIFIVERISAPLPSLAQAASMSYPVHDASLAAALTPNGSNVFTGGTTMTVSWDPAQSSAPPVDGLNIQIADGPANTCRITDVTPNVSFGVSLNPDDSPRTLATFTANSPALNQPFPSANSILACNSSPNTFKRTNMVKLSSHRKDGLQIQSVIEYSNN